MGDVTNNDESGQVGVTDSGPVIGGGNPSANVMRQIDEMISLQGRDEAADVTIDEPMDRTGFDTRGDLHSDGSDYPDPVMPDSTSDSDSEPVTDPTEARFSQLEDKLNILTDSIATFVQANRDRLDYDSQASTVSEPEPEPIDPLDEMDFEEAMSDAGKFSAVMRKAMDFRADQINKKINQLTEIMNKLPDLVMSNVQRSSQSERVIDTFFRENPDIDFRHRTEPGERYYANVVASIAQGIANDNPTWDEPRVLAETAKTARNVLRLDSKNTGKTKATSRVTGMISKMGGTRAPADSKQTTNAADRMAKEIGLMGLI